MFYYTPYSYYLEPSYWEFRNMCKINELPNTEEKYNKILSYFDTSLDTLDWEELNEKTWKISEDSGDYKKGVFEYATLSREKEINFRLGIIAAFYSNQSPITRHNTNVMAIDGTWHTRRYYFKIANLTRYDDMWIEKTLACYRVAKENMTPRGVKNE
ncbi:hypothetical protein [uncultured Helicobacter sp.]|uniref:hypothetical protein n=1 Tax=uncultured Helicobacter sp. TaxID=175537 RepID=UPI00374E61E7